MIRYCLLVFFFIASGLICSAETFYKWFSDGTMRIDFVLAGYVNKTNFYLHRIIKEPHWGGGKNNMVDTFHYGDYFFTVKDVKTGELIYSRGFSTLFREWQTTSDALVNQRSFTNSIRFPYPLNTIYIEVFVRKKDHSLAALTNLTVNPADPQIEIATGPDLKTKTILYNGPPDKKLDLVILAEGYTKGRMKKFKRDAKRLTAYMFSSEPFSSFRDKFNIILAYSISRQSGTDIPDETIWKNTAVNTNFYTFGIERYLTSADYWKIAELASCVPYDQIIILVNSEKYGGGGIFNFYSICTSDHNASPGVFVHEFGHAFAGLGDEYYTSDVTYEGFYDLNYEPWEPNLTTLKQFERKWMDLVPLGTPVPTPADKRYANSVGAFEGGGYIPKGMFRPQINCRMKDNSYDEFCQVCKRAIEKMINFNIE